jgi:hypothetical protein
MYLEGNVHFVCHSSTFHEESGMSRDAKLLYATEAVTVAAFLLASADVPSFFIRLSVVLWLFSVIHFRSVKDEWIKYRLRDLAVVAFFMPGFLERPLYFSVAIPCILLFINHVRYHDGVPLWLRASAEESRKIEEESWERLVRLLPPEKQASARKKHEYDKTWDERQRILQMEAANRLEGARLRVKFWREHRLYAGRGMAFRGQKTEDGGQRTEDHPESSSSVSTALLNTCQG